MSDRHYELEHVETRLFAAIRGDDGERYVFLFDDSEASAVALVRTLAEFARDPELDFSVEDGLQISAAAERVIAASRAANGTRGRG